jgi:hypothetical protein
MVQELEIVTSVIKERSCEGVWMIYKQRLREPVLDEYLGRHVFRLVCLAGDRV